MDAFLDEIRERRREKKQRDQEALVTSQDVTKISEATGNGLTSKQDGKTYPNLMRLVLGIGSVSCALSKLFQVNTSKLACNLENREESSRSKSCDMGTY